MRRSLIVTTGIFTAALITAIFYRWHAPNGINFTAVHPGILVDTEQIALVKNKLTEQPWQGAFRQAAESSLGAKNYQPAPVPEVVCGSYSNPNIGCTAETNDAGAAYTQALLWSYTGDSEYAENVRRILHAWATTLERGHTNSNAPLQAAWSAVQFSKALEIVSHTYPAWPQADTTRVTEMFEKQFLPSIRLMFQNGTGYACHNKNWHGGGIEALLNIGIVNNDKQMIDQAIAYWKGLVPAYIYLKTDGSRPKDAPWCSRNSEQVRQHWYQPPKFVDGLAQETCRDLSHTAHGLASIINIAETARIQGIDLYATEQQRIVSALELHSRYQNETPGEALCPQPLAANTYGTFEIAYNHYALRLGTSMPNTKAFLERHRPQPGVFHYRWETLTHGLTATPSLSKQ